jgi:hypothetical protein
MLLPKKLHGNTFDLIGDVSEFPTVASLEAVDGGTQHAVTVVGRYVFDSNCERVLPLTRRSLDYCCSTDTTKGMYKKVYRGYRFALPPNTTKYCKYSESFREKLQNSILILTTGAQQGNDEEDTEDESD